MGKAGLQWNHFILVPKVKSLWILSVLTDNFVCACMSMCELHACVGLYVQVCLPMYGHVKARGWYQVPSSGTAHPTLLRQCLSVNLKLTDWKDQLVSKLQQSFCLCTPSSGVTNMYLCTCFFPWVLGNPSSEAHVCSVSPVLTEPLPSPDRNLLIQRHNFI